LKPKSEQQLLNWNPG